MAAVVTVATISSARPPRYRSAPSSRRAGRSPSERRRRRASAPHQLKLLLAMMACRQPRMRARSRSGFSPFQSMISASAPPSCASRTQAGSSENTKNRIAADSLAHKPNRLAIIVERARAEILLQVVAASDMDEARGAEADMIQRLLASPIEVVAKHEIVADDAGDVGEVSFALPVAGELGVPAQGQYLGVEPQVWFLDYLRVRLWKERGKNSAKASPHRLDPA